jgi:lon-related putative ATP-dependent protease
MKIGDNKKLSADGLTPQIELHQIEHCMAQAYPDDYTIIGQKRAQNAIDFALGMDLPGYNVYVMGEPALGRFTMVQEKLKQQSKNRNTPADWLYLNNFDEHRQPAAIFMPAGQGKVLCDDIDSLIDEILDTFPAAFDNPNYQRQKRTIDGSFNKKYDHALEQVEKIANQHDVALFEESGVISFAPVIEGKQLDDAEFALLGDDDKQYFYEVIERLENALNEALIELPRWKRETSEKLRELQQSTVETAIKPLLKQLEFKYTSHLGIIKYFKELKKELIDAVLEWLAEESDEANKDDLDKKAMLTEYIAPNMLVSHEEQGAPVIYEPNPTFGNLFGKVEYTSQPGSIVTSYRSIQSGALHRANGGYLIMDAIKLMENSQVWDALKLSLKSRQIKTDLAAQDSAVGASFTLRPQLIPLDVKIILLGSRDLYYTVQEYDDEFNELFRVLADFDYYIPATDKYQFQLISRIQKYATDTLALSVDASAFSSLLRFSHRQAEHQNKLSARFADVIELTNEAAYFAKQDGENHIDSSHVEEALASKQYRTGQISESFMTEIKEGHVLIETQGEQVGCVNGLTVLHIGDTSFGTPAKITATVYAGSDGIIDIEREADLGKSIHSKGVMLLTGYLGNKYAQDFALTLSANIAIEQSYGSIDGDSASLAELCALVSAITRLPIDQGIALTGSINQHGEVQAIGGVNEKIEGFFKLCQMRGFNGKQGVIIPQSNVHNLVLNDSVLNAVKREQFHIYAVDKVDDAFEILLGKSAGELSAKGTFGKDTIHDLALRRLSHFAEVINGGVEE